MAISGKFKEAAERYTGMVDKDIAKAMEAKGYFFGGSEWTNDNPPRPVEDWETLVEELGGEEALNADFDEEGDPAFTITHIESGKSASGNGSVTVLAELWLMVKEVS